MSDYPGFRFLTSRPEETLAEGDLMGSSIPTLGHPALAHDHYRIVSYADGDFGLFNVCFTDVETCASLGRLVEGPITSFADLEVVETALNALLFHQNIEVFVPTIKVEINGFRTYARPDEGVRPQLVFDMFSIARTRDWLCAYDYALVTNGKIARTERRDNRLKFTEYGDFRKFRRFVEPMAADVLSGLALDFKVPGYFSNEALLARYRSPHTFTHELYDRVRVPWRECVTSVPGIEFAIDLPLLIAIVLDRAKARAEIPDAVKELHDQLGPVRHELYEFDRLLHEDLDQQQAELERKATRIKEAFIAIVPESRADTAWRVLARAWKIGKSIPRGYAIAINPAAIDREQLQELLETVNELVMNNTGLVDRTITSRVFTKLLRTKSIFGLLKRHFSEAELRALEKSP